MQHPQPKTQNTSSSATHPDRTFLIGLVPTPKSDPNTTFDDITAAYREAGELGEVTMIWPEKTGIGEYGKLQQSRVVTAVRVYGLKPIITLNFATIKTIPGQGLQQVVDAPDGTPASLGDPQFCRLWVDEAEKIAAEFKP